MILFLDFDGVLHTSPAGAAGIFCHLPRLESLLRSRPEVRVIISSSWRETYPADVIFEIFAEDICPMIIGMTPVLKFGSRYDEICAWITNENYAGRWLALDDDKNGFPTKCPQLILCDTVVGFDGEAEQRLLAALNYLSRE